MEQPGEHAEQTHNNPEATNATTPNPSSGPEDDEYEGEPPDADGWHQFPIHPKSNKALVYVAHKGDFEWLKSLKGKFPPGIRTPEGYMWGREPDEFLWIESAPNFVSRCTTSQIRLLDPRVSCEVFTEDGKPISTEIKDADDEIIEMMLGKPTIVPPHSYSQANHRLAVFLGIGPDKLDVHIPYSDLPRLLDVYDDDDVTNLLKKQEDDVNSDMADNIFDRLEQKNCPRFVKSPGAKPHRYRLVDPNRNGEARALRDNTSHATLMISKSRQFGSGSTGHVYEAQIELEITHKNEEAEDKPAFPPVLTVIAKVSSGAAGTEFLQNEATVYHSFPEHFKHEYTGYQLIKPCHIPRKLTQLVPHFYGYYESVDKTRAPLLMMEDCGSPITPESLTQYQKAEIIAMFQRIHHAHYLHSSIARRNILAQPGPVKKDTGYSISASPRWARSALKPSFRIVDFGRTRNVSNDEDPEIDSKLDAERSVLSELLKMHLPIGFSTS